MKISKKAAIVAAAILAVSVTSQAFDLTSLKSSLSSSKIGSIIDGVISTDDVSISDLVGTWTYSSPAVTFASEDLLEKAGGAAAAAELEEELEPYYTQAGFTGMTFEFDSDGNVTVTFSSGKTLTGTVTEGDEDGTMIFNFSSKLSKVSSKLSSVGNMTAYVTKGTALSIMFDASKLQTVVSTLASVSGNTSLSTLSSLLSSYEGVYAGFKFTN